MPGKPTNKNAWRRQKAKEKAATKPAEPETTAAPNDDSEQPDEPVASDQLKAAPVKAPENAASVEDIDIEAQDGDARPVETFELADGYEISEDDPLFEMFKDVFKKFRENGDDGETERVPDIYYDGDNIQDEEEEANTKNKLTKRARRQAKMMSVAQLKAAVDRPELVEWTDIFASEPHMLVAIKANRNVVPVPGHWTVKREFLSTKRGIEKAPFALPKFILDTGIADSRDADLEKQKNMSLKQKQRERVQGKLGKLDIDYQKMHDAFFKFQTKPMLTRFGEVYYEGKEYEINLKHLRPGRMSEELKDALGMVPNGPPPWLLNMQRHGPPPSYPGMKIPGLNAQIPGGASWGYQQGGWGKPPVDETNNLMYDMNAPTEAAKTPEPEKAKEPKVDTALWGEIEAPQEKPEEFEDEDDSEEEDEDEEGEDEDEEMEGDMPPGAGARGESVPSSGAATPEAGDAWVARPQHRNGRPVSAAPDEDEPEGRRSLYTVVQETAADSGVGFLGSSKRYNVKGAEKSFNAPVLGQEDTRSKRRTGDVDVSVDIDSLQDSDKISKREVRRQFEEAAETKKAKNPWADMDMDLDDMISEELGKRRQDDEERGKRRKTGRR